jgi:hypothetical protein
MKKFNEKHITYVFPMSLTGSVSRWYYFVDIRKTGILGELKRFCDAILVKHYD